MNVFLFSRIDSVQAIWYAFFSGLFFGFLLGLARFLFLTVFERKEA